MASSGGLDGGSSGGPTTQAAIPSVNATASDGVSSSGGDGSTLDVSYLVEAFLMPAVALFGLIGNSLTIYILRQREVKLKRDFVEILCSLATFDNLLLVCSFFLFSMPRLCTEYDELVFAYTGKKK